MLPLHFAKLFPKETIGLLLLSPDYMSSCWGRGRSADSRYSTISDMLENDLRPIIELRNKLAHGQWVYPLNSRGNDVAQKQMDALRQENLLSLQFKKNLVSKLADLVHDLVVSLPTFQRDFDKNYAHIEDTRRNLQTRSYESWVKQMQQKYLRGKTRRSKAPSS